MAGLPGVGGGLWLPGISQPAVMMNAPQLGAYASPTAAPPAVEDPGAMLGADVLGDFELGA